MLSEEQLQRKYKLAAIWRKNNKAVIQRYRDSLTHERMREYHLRHYYGMSSEEYNRRLAEQGGLCAICRGPNTSSRPFGVDHDHETGKIRGLVHNLCNSHMTVFDSEYLFKRFMDYKRRNGMAARASRIGRVIQYFRECDIEELQYVIMRGTAILKERAGTEERRLRQAIAAGGSKRTRRTKAQVAADRGANANPQPDAHDLSIGA